MSNSTIVSITGIGLKILLRTAGIVCTLSLGNKVLHKSIINNYNKYKKQNERSQQTIKSFDKLYQKSSQKNLVDEDEYEPLCNFSTKYSEESQNEVFL